MLSSNPSNRTKQLSTPALVGSICHTDQLATEESRKTTLSETKMVEFCFLITFKLTLMIFLIVISIRKTVSFKIDKVKQPCDTLSK